MTNEEPVKPLCYEAMDGTKIYNCRNCGALIEPEIIVPCKQNTIKMEMKYCHHCGKEIDWEG